MKKILVTPRSLTKGGDPSLEVLRTAGYQLVFSTPGKLPDEQELVGLVPGCVGWLAGVEKITAQVLDAATDLRAISRNGTGVDAVDLDACKRHGVNVLRAEGANARGVAELTLALLLALSRSIPFGDAGLKMGRWGRRMGSELAGKTLGLVGCGRIGKIVARFALAMDMKVIAYDEFPDSGFAPSLSFCFLPMEDVLRESDFLSLHCPYQEGERPVINREAIEKTRRGLFLVNTARAGLVDPEALLEALEKGHVAGYGVDVFATEPPAVDVLISNDRVIASPHVGAYTKESVARVTRQAVENLLSAITES